MGFLGKIFGHSSELDDYRKWASNASKQEISDALEENRQRFLKTGDYGPTEEILKEAMHQILEEEWENDPYINRDPNYRWTDENRWDK